MKTFREVLDAVVDLHDLSLDLHVEGVEIEELNSYSHKLSWVASSVQGLSERVLSYLSLHYEGERLIKESMEHDERVNAFKAAVIKQYLESLPKGTAE